LSLSLEHRKLLHVAFNARSSVAPTHDPRNLSASLDARFNAGQTVGYRHSVHGLAIGAIARNDNTTQKVFIEIRTSFPFNLRNRFSKHARSLASEPRFVLCPTWWW
jgi:hypothetical protein